jgi:prepilin-type processing-associated H-X9-DG protein
MLFGSLAVSEFSGMPSRDGPVFADPIVNRLYLAGSIVLPILAISLALGGDKFVRRSKRLVVFLIVILSTPLIHWVLLMGNIAGVIDSGLISLSVFELATIASVPFLLITGRRAASVTSDTPLPVWVESSVVGGIVIVTSMLMLVPISDRSPSRRANCASNLKQIGLAIAMYADSYQGRCPMDSSNPTLVGSMQLLSNVLPSAKVLYCPGDSRRDARPESNFAKLTLKNISYSYIPNLKWQDTPDSSLMSDRIYTTAAGDKWPTDGNHKAQGGNILFNDGHVAWNLTLPSALKDKNGNLVVLSP